MSVIGIPNFAGSLVVTITVPDAHVAGEFYGRAFSAEEMARYVVPRAPAGTTPVKQVHLRIGGATVLVSSANPRNAETMERFGAKPPRMLNGFSSVLTLYVEDVDAALRRAVAAGAREAAAPQDSLWGDRIAAIEDPFGHVWGLAAVIEEISVAEHNRRWEAASKRGSAPRLELPVRGSRS